MPRFFKFLLLAVAVGLAFAWFFRGLDAAKEATLVRALEAPGGGAAFDPAALEGLPEGARRYLAGAIAPGTPLAGSATLSMKGRFHVGGAGAWAPFTAEQALSPEGFLWRAEMGEGARRVKGGDYYYKGSARVLFRAWGFFTVIRLEDPNTTRSSAGRLAGELVMLPSALLPREGVRWLEAEPGVAVAEVKVGEETARLRIALREDASPARLDYDRWGLDPRTEAPASVPFRVDFAEARTFGGYRIPGGYSAGWAPAGAAFQPFIEAEIAGATFR